MSRFFFVRCNRIIPAILTIAAILFLLIPFIAMASEPPRTVRLIYLETLGRPSSPAVKTRVIVIVSPDRTTVTEEGGTLIIDYLHHEIIRQKSQQSVAVHYPLRPSRPAEQHLQLDEMMMARLGSYRIFSSRQGGSYHGLPVTETMIRFGMGLTQARTAAPLESDFFGQRFGERTLQIEASPQVPHFARLAASAECRREVVRANPLLLQLDLINLIPLVGGLPLSLREQPGKTLEFLDLQLVEDGR